MKIALFIPVFATLAACASTSEIRTISPSGIYQSALPAKAVAKCVLAKLEPQFSMASVQYRDTDTGASVWVEMQIYAGKDTAVMIDSENAQTGSVTKFYSRILSGEAKYRAAIASCVA